MDEFEDQTEDLSAIPRPGQLVRKAREQRGLSVPELCQRCKLTENVVRTLEADDFAGLGQPVYARGYYRKCAEVLGLNASLLIEAYEKLSGTGSPVPEIKQRPSIAYREGPNLWAVGLSLALLAVLVGSVSWWMVQRDDTAQSASPAGVPRMAEPLEEDQTPAAPADSLSGDEAPMTASRPTPAPTAAPRVAAVTPAPQPVATPAPVAVAAVATPAPQARPDPTPRPEPAAPPRLRVEMSKGDSWTEITDSRGEVLLYKLLRQGDVRIIEGQPPYEVYLGRGDQVSIWLNDRKLNIRPVIQSDLRARFTIDNNGEIRG